MSKSLADGEIMYYCDQCEGVLDDNVMCDCQEYAKPSALRSAFDVSCQTCGETGSIEWVSLHDCELTAQGGRCEDFPACGHPFAEGCQTRPEHTSAYWHRMRDHLGDERYEELDQMGYWNQMG